MSPYDENLDKKKANYVPLTPLSFLQRAKDIYPDYEAIVYEDKINTGKYYFEKILPRAQSHYVVGTSGSQTTMNAKFN